MLKRGYDTYLRPVGAYSTLGWFKDPIFSTMLEYGDAGLVEVILHEMVHRTIFVKHHGAFNEGVATFVGEKGTETFFLARGGWNPGDIEELREKREAKRLFQETMFQMADRLRLLYGLDLEETEKLSRKGKIFEEMKASLREELERLGTTRYQRILGVDWNNAFLVSYLTYHQDPDLWEAVYDRFDQDLTAMVAWLKQLERDKDPLSFVQRWLSEGEPTKNH
jgi:predicted aminopeptidase